MAYLLVYLILWNCFGVSGLRFGFEGNGTMCLDAYMLRRSAGKSSCSFSRYCVAYNARRFGKPLDILVCYRYGSCERDICLPLPSWQILYASTTYMSGKGTGGRLLMTIDEVTTSRQRYCKISLICRFFSNHASRRP